MLHNIYFSREYLKEESKDKKGKEMDTTGWILHSKERHVSHVSREFSTFYFIIFIYFGHLGIKILFLRKVA